MFDKARWNELKSKRLKKTRGVSFEEIIKAKIVDVIDNISRPGQKMILVDYKSYIWVIPFIENEQGTFLKTLYQSRKHTKLYRGRESK